MAWEDMPSKYIMSNSTEKVKRNRRQYIDAGAATGEKITRQEAAVAGSGLENKTEKRASVKRQEGKRPLPSARNRIRLDDVPVIVQSDVPPAKDEIPASKPHIVTHGSSKSEFEELRQLAQTESYHIDQVLARGAESVLYTGSMAGQQVCIKAIRNGLNKWIGDSLTRQHKEKLDNVAYKTKVRHLLNEYDISNILYSGEQVPVVHIYALRKVKSFGLELGYDLIMEYLNGHDLADKILSRTLELPDKIAAFAQAVQALDYMHQKNLIHLDIKPSNFVMHCGRVKLIDFGVSVVNGYKPKAVTGTTGYMSPEQICKEKLDKQTDIFALGVTFAVFFGGKMLNQVQEELMTKQSKNEAKFRLDKEVVPSILEVPDLEEAPEIADIIKECTIPCRKSRPASCQHILARIRKWAKQNGVAIEGLTD